MKSFSQILVATIVLFLSFNVVQAQDENNPWAVGLGVNAVDFYPTGKADKPLPGVSETLLDDAFNTDHWNIVGSFTRLSIGHYVGSGFVVELGASLNEIDQIGNISVGELTYFGADANVYYSFRELWNKQSWLDPYLGLGAGYTWIGDFSTITTNGTLGLNFWFNDNVAIYAQSAYKEGYASSDAIDKWVGNDHFQHSLGIKFAFGGTDTDGDGVFDNKDACIDMPGLPEFSGCPDSDGDGVPDAKDDCKDKAGLAVFNGCADTDADGVPDLKDDCPTTAGLETLQGCPDADADGVKDKEDLCPDIAGPVVNNGCPYEDSDEDGVLDKDDHCPEVAGILANNGCPKVTVEVIKELNEYSKTILFDLNKARINESSYGALDAIVTIMNEYENAHFHIAGYTDSTGKASYNEMLSRKRAASVREYLTTHGVDADRLTSEGYGEKNPIATNTTAAGRQQNRRVEVGLEKNKPGN